MGRRGPDLGAVDQIAAVGLGGAGLRREQIGAGIRLAHADRKTDLAAADARQDVHLDVLGRVFQQHRAALPVGDEEAPRRRVGDAHFLGHHIALEERALVAAIFLRPGHAEPAACADPAGKFRRVGVFAVGLVRIEGAGGDFVGEEGAHFLAQLLAFGRQGSASADMYAAELRRLARPVAASAEAEIRIHRSDGGRAVSTELRPPKGILFDFGDTVLTTLKWDQRGRHGAPPADREQPTRPQRGRRARRRREAVGRSGALPAGFDDRVPGPGLSSAAVRTAGHHVRHLLGRDRAGVLEGRHGAQARGRHRGCASGAARDGPAARRRQQHEQPRSDHLAGAGAERGSCRTSSSSCPARTTACASRTRS